MITTPLGYTFRQLLEHVDRKTLLDVLDVRCDPKNRPGYERVIDELLTKPSTPPYFSLLVSYYPETVRWAGNPEEFTDEECVHVHLLNPRYEPPPEDLKPYYGEQGQPIPAGHYDATQDKYFETFGFGPTKWIDIIDADVVLENPDGVHKMLPSLTHIAAEILWELTFMGFSEERQQEKWAEIMGAVDILRKEQKDNT